MKYEDMMKKARETGSTRRITAEIKTWKEKGDLLVGKVVEVSLFTKGKFAGEVNSYTLDTDEGLVKTVLGHSTDEQIKDAFEVGDVLIIEFQGQKALDDGRRANMFTVSVLKDAELTAVEDNNDAASTTKEKGKAKG